MTPRTLASLPYYLPDQIGTQGRTLHPHKKTVANTQETASTQDSRARSYRAYKGRTLL
jgi:hypothetical protein